MRYEASAGKFSKPWDGLRYVLLGLARSHHGCGLSRPRFIFHPWSLEVITSYSIEQVRTAR